MTGGKAPRTGDDAARIRDGNGETARGARRQTDDRTIRKNGGDADIVEVKRMFVRPAMRGRGISRVILSALEDIARGFNYRIVMLETGTRQVEAMRLYDTSGYERTDCYGIYVDEPLSVCYKKML